MLGRGDRRGDLVAEAPQPRSTDRDDERFDRLDAVLEVPETALDELRTGKWNGWRHGGTVTLRCTPRLLSRRVGFRRLGAGSPVGPVRRRRKNRVAGSGQRHVDDVSIDGALARLGLSGPHADRARALLHDARLTNPRKRRIAVAKVEPARAVIDAAFARLCHECARSARGDDRTLVRVPPAVCARCGGSQNARALDELAECCQRAGVRRLVVVGGSPSFRTDFERVGDRLELRLVDGVARRTKAEARADIAWADVVVVCGSTQLAHRVSTLYTRDADARARLVTTSRRGMTHIADEIARHLDGRAAGGRRRA